MSKKTIAMIALAFGIIQVFSNCLAPSSYGDDVRTIWDNGSGDNEFTNNFNWVAAFDTTFESGDNNQLPGYEAGAPSNAIIQSGGQPVNLNSDFTPVFPFSPLIVRGGGNKTLNINANLNIGTAGFLAGQTNDDNFVNHAAGTVTIGSLAVGNTSAAALTSEYNLSGTGFLNPSGTITVNDSGIFSLLGDTPTVSVGDDLTLVGASTLDFQLGATGVNAISVTDQFNIDPLALLTIDATGYTGGPSVITLVDAATMSGTFLGGNYTVTGLGAEGGGWTLGQNVGGSGDLLLNILPEPSSFVLMLLGLAGLSLRRRRRRR